MHNMLHNVIPFVCGPYVVINIYMPTNSYVDEEKDKFYDEKQAIIIKLSQKYKKGIKILMKDWNIKVEIIIKNM